ncbi:MAG TPA: hypothetical protein VL523_02115 [Terriglobia bacterium]|nr:hypothetical protein [Terriglobia bacterium]
MILVLEADVRRFSRFNAVLLVSGLAAGFLALAATNLSAKSPDLITVTVVVSDAESGQPINQAQLTLVFKQPGEGRMSRAKTLTFSAKTDSHGRGRFLDIPEGDVRLLVTHEHHQAFGKDFEVSKEASTLQVKLKPPQPVL